MGRLAVGVVALTCVALLASAVTLRADPAPQAPPEQDGPASLLTQALDVLPTSTDATRERDRIADGGSTGDNGSGACLGRRTARLRGMPRRSVGRALFQTTMVNVVYGIANLIRGQVTARITPKTWWANMENGWVGTSTISRSISSVIPTRGRVISPRAVPTA